MSHPQQIQYIDSVKKQYKEHFINKCVLEVGSLNINGSVRPFFENCAYIGLDVSPGPCVDVVCLGHEYDMPDGSFDTVISCECFEHNPYWVETFQNMIRLCKPGGLIIMTCATEGRPEHGTKEKEPESSPLTVGLNWNYYKNLVKEDFESHFDLTNIFKTHSFQTNTQSKDLYFHGIKK